MPTSQEYGYVSIAIRAVRATRTAAIDDGSGHVVATGNQGEEAAGGFLGILVDAVHANPTINSGFMFLVGLSTDWCFGFARNTRHH